MHVAVWGASSPDVGQLLRLNHRVRWVGTAARRTDQELPGRQWRWRRDDLRGVHLIHFSSASGEREGRCRLLRRWGEREEEGGRGGVGGVIEADPAEGEARQEDEREEYPAEGPHRCRQPRRGCRKGMEWARVSGGENFGGVWFGSGLAIGLLRGEGPEGGFWNRSTT